MALKAKDLEAKDEKKSKAKGKTSENKQSLKQRSDARRQRQEKQYDSTMSPMESRLGGMEMDSASVGALPSASGDESAFKFASQTNAPAQTKATETSGCADGSCSTGVGTTSTVGTLGSDAPTAEEVEALRAEMFPSPQAANAAQPAETPMAMDTETQPSQSPTEIVESINLTGQTNDEISGGQQLSPQESTELSAGKFALANSSFEASVKTLQSSIANMTLEKNKIDGVVNGTSTTTGLGSSQHGQRIMMTKHSLELTREINDVTTKLIQIRANHESAIRNEPLKQSVVEANKAIAQDATASANKTDVEAQAIYDGTVRGTQDQLERALDGFEGALAAGDMKGAIAARTYALNTQLNFVSTTMPELTVAQTAGRTGGDARSSGVPPGQDTGTSSSMYATELSKAETRIEMGMNQMAMGHSFRNWQALSTSEGLTEDHRATATANAVNSIIDYHIGKVTTDPETGIQDLSKLGNPDIANQARMDMGNSMEMILTQERGRGEDANPDGLMKYFDAVNTGFDVRVQTLTSDGDRTNFSRLIQDNSQLPSATGVPMGTPAF